MITNTKEMLEKAKINNYCVPHFNINNLEWTKYILEECQNLNSPVIIGVSEGAIKYMGGHFTVANLVKSLVIDLNITIPVAIHLDHGSSFESCKKCIDSGFSSVMIDASKLSLEENIKITKEVVDYAHLYGVTVEAEVGHIGGIEDGQASDIAYAKVEDCLKLVNETKIDSLTPAVGSVHGVYKGEPNIKIDLIKEVKAMTNLPLVLHGGSGIPDVTIIKSIEAGITKLNINTDLQIVWAKAVRDYLNSNQEVYDPRKVIRSGEQAIKNKIKEKVLLLGSNNKVNV